MRRTLLLVFIHGFKGGDDTFGTFPSHIRALISHALPQINITTVQYPRFETRGNLKETVARLREWLENKVIDLEVANATPSPTIDPSVHIILVGHSMGGIVAAETLLLLANERPIPSASSKPDQNDHGRPRNPGKVPFMFPHVQGLLAFDTPYLGLAPEMVAHSLEGGHKAVASAWGAASEVASIFGLGGKATANAARPGYRTTKSVGALPAPGAKKTATVDAAAVPAWQSLGKYAMFAGAAGAVAASGAAALYSQREKISAGWSWATSHLLFVGDLAKPELLKKRIADTERVVVDRSLGGWVNLYTNLGRGAREGYGITETISGKERTFCNLPVSVKEANNSSRITSSSDATSDYKDVAAGSNTKLRWLKAVNDKAKDETAAHVSMFFPHDNPGFYNLSNKTVEVVCSFIDRGWYDSSNDDTSDHHDEPIGPSSARPMPPPSAFTDGSPDKDWEGIDAHGHVAGIGSGHEVDDDVVMREETDDEKETDEMESSIIVENMRSSAGGFGA